VLAGGSRKHQRAAHGAASDAPAEQRHGAGHRNRRGGQRRRRGVLQFHARHHSVPSTGTEEHTGARSPGPYIVIPRDGHGVVVSPACPL
jgi:hypothetical protein